MKVWLLLLVNAIFLLMSCNSNAQNRSSMANTSTASAISDDTSDTQMQLATFGEGCFWCIEPIYDKIKGVKDVTVGFTGGEVEDPTYRQVVSGQTGHAEVARITFDPEMVSYKQLLEVFWHTHNPTTKNRQGADVGTQYRSVIFYHNEKQKRIAEKSLEKTDQSSLWEDPIVTDIEPLDNFYRAENYHQKYFENNPNAGYCNVVIAPKVKKFRKEFPDLLKDE